MSGPESTTRRLKPETDTELLEISHGFQLSRALLTACELEVFTALGDAAMPASELAGRIGADPAATERLLNAMCALGVLNKADERFSNAPVAQRYLVRGAPEYIAPLYITQTWDNWARLTDAVRRGKPIIVQPFRDPARIWLSALGAALRRGWIRLWQVLSRSDRWLNAFVDYLRGKARRRAAAVIRLLDLSDVSSALDIGGGPGIYATTFARASEGLTITVLDRPEVVAIARRNIAREGLGDRVHTVGANFHRDAIAGDYDLVFISETVHANSSAENEVLVRKAAAVLTPGGRLVVHDYILDDDRTGPLYGALFSLEMLLVREGADNYTGAQVREWMTAAGLERIERVETGVGTTLMIAHKVSV